MKKFYNKTLLFTLLALPLAFSCQDKEDAKPVSELHTDADIKDYRIVGQQADIEIDALKRSVAITLDGNITSGANLIADFTLSEGAKAMAGNTAQVSGQTTNNFETPLVYSVTSEDGKNTKQWNITATNNATTLPWGLGHFQKQQRSNEKNYSWYFDQGNTGAYSSINCGPTSTTMVAKWSDATFSKTPIDARNAYRSTGGWWYTGDIVSYLRDNSIPNWYINLAGNIAGTQQLIKNEIDKGNVIILCLDAYYISNGPKDDRRVSKFYNTNAPQWGHFIVVKGYKQVDNTFFFEVYDPFSFGVSYSDGSIKGKDRYYKSGDIFEATSLWWNYAIVVSDKSASGGRLAKEKGLDPELVPQQWGR